MTPARHSISLSDFINGIAAIDIRRQLTIPLATRKHLLATCGNSCPLCRQPFNWSSPRGYAHPVVASYIHTLLGGPLLADNFFVCCRRCQNSRQASDLLAFDGVPDALLAQRTAVLQQSVNHLVHLPSTASLPQVRQALAARHAFPRSRVYAAQCDDGTCLLAVSRRYGDGQSKGLAHLLGRLAGAPAFKDSGLAVYSCSDVAFLDAVWKLIEANAWVVGLARRGQLRDHLDWWWLTSASVSELRARKVGRLVAPAPVVVREVGASAIRQRRLVARRRLEEEIWLLQRELENAERAADAFVADGDQPGVVPTDPEVAIELLLRPAQLHEHLEQLEVELAAVRKRTA